MEKINRDEIFNRWSSILDSVTGLTGSKASWISEYTNNIDKVEIGGITSLPYQPGITLLPLAIKVASQTIGMDLVSIKPITFTNTEEEMDRIEGEVKSINRDGKLDSIINDVGYKEMKVEDHPDIKKPPIGKLMYMDFKYEPSGTSSGFRSKW